MKMNKLIKKCNRCEKKGKHKRFFVGSQFPYYEYVGFDLCDKCESELDNLLIKFMGNKND